MQIDVTVQDANNILCEVTPPQSQIIVIDRGVEGNGIVSIVPVTISTFQYLRITYTNGTVQDVGPLTSTAYTATAPITIVGNTISLATVPIASGGTDATTAAGAIQNLLPSYTGNANKRLGLNSLGTALEWVLDGGGTVTSVAASGGTTGLTFTGSPITTSGTLTLGGTLAVANGGTGVTSSTGTGSVVLSTSPTLVTPVLGTPTSGNFSTGTFTWPTFNQNTTGTAANITATSNSTLTTLSALNLPGSQVSGNISGNAANVTGVVAIANGGTGQTTANAALNALLPTQTGNASKYLQTDGTNSSWDAISLSTADITGILPTANGGTGLGGATPFTSGGVVYASSASALTTGSALTFNGTNLTFGSTGQRITGDMSNATLTSRLYAQTSTTNTGTSFGVLPNGTSGVSQYIAYGASDPTNTQRMRVGVNSASVYLISDISGTGSYLPMTFEVSGSEQMRLNSTGLGIGNSSPAYKLDVTGTLGVSGNVTLSGGTANGVAYLNGSKVVTSDSALTFDGTTLTAVNDTNARSIILSRTSATARNWALGVDGDGGFRLTDTTGSVVTLSALPSGITFLAAQSDLAFRYNSTTEGMRLTSTGLGIGTSSPAWKLTISDGTTTGGMIPNGGNLYMGTITNSPVVFRTNNADAMTLTSTGLGIGTSSPATKLEVTGDIGGTWTAGATRFVGSQYLTGSSYQLGMKTTMDTRETQIFAKAADTGGYVTIATGLTPSERLRVDGSGNVGIGTTLPTAKLTISGGAFTVNSTNGADGLLSRPTVDGNGFALVFNKNRNGSAVVNGDGLGTIYFQGFDGSNNQFTAGIAAAVTGTVSAGNVPTALIFQTSSASFPSERARITSSGNLLLGTTSDQGRKLQVSGAIALVDAALNSVGDMSINSSGVMSIAPYNGSGSTLTFNTNPSGSGVSERARISSNGQLLVNTTTEIVDNYAATTRPAVVSANGIAATGIGNTGSTSRISKIFAVAPGNTYTVRVYPSNNVYAITDIRGGGYCSSGSGSANSFFSYGGHTGAYQLNTVFNTFTGNMSISAPSVSGAYIQYTITITGGSAGQYIVMVDDAGVSTDKTAFIVVV